MFLGGGEDKPINRSRSEAPNKGSNQHTIESQEGNSRAGGRDRSNPNRGMFLGGSHENQSQGSGLTGNQVTLNN